MMQTAAQWIPDKYTRRARLQPALLVVMPAAFALFSLLASATPMPSWTSALLSLFLSFGGMALLSQLARDGGKRREAALFELWGGKPTTRLLRHRDNPNDALRERRHKKLQKLVSGQRLPTAEGEAADPIGADGVYDACVARLLELTRNQTKFPLIFEENCNYGFRRNLWGTKRMGLTVTITSVLTAGGSVLTGLLSQRAVSTVGVVCLAADVLFLLAWIFVFTPSWVRIPADAYAERLLAACETLPSR